MGGRSRDVGPDRFVLVDLTGDRYASGSGWSRYLTARAQVAYWDETDATRLCVPTSVSAPYRDMAGLEVRAQADDQSYDGSGFYGMAVEYRDVTVRSHELEAMVKRIRQIERHLESLNVRFGYPRGLAGWLARFADAIGCADGRPFLVRDAKHAQITGRAYRQLDVEGLADWVERQARLWLAGEPGDWVRAA